MKRRIVASLGWIIFAACVVNAVVSVIIFSRDGQALFASVVIILVFLAFPLVGALIVSQRPSNTVGWIFSFLGVGTATTSLSAAYVTRALVIHADTQLATRVIDLAGDLVWPANLALGVLLLYLFPDGKPLSRRWGLAVWALLFSLAALEFGQAIAPGPLEANGLVQNPLGMPALSGVSSVLLTYATWPLPLLALLAVISLILRYARASGSQRQQIKWFVFGAAVTLAFGVATPIVTMLISSDPNDPIATAVGNIIFALGLLALPIGVGTGVLRYRLYDIDILINRTLVYGSLTAILAALYFALVIGAQTLTQRVTGHHAAQQPLVIVLSTLLIAALVQPLRRRLQGAIDRRFYRSRYDAARTVAAFSASLRQEVELSNLSAHLLSVVEDTMRPSHVSLWLTQPSRASSADDA